MNKKLLKSRKRTCNALKQKHAELRKRYPEQLKTIKRNMELALRMRNLPMLLQAKQEFNELLKTVEMPHGTEDMPHEAKNML